MSVDQGEHSFPIEVLVSGEELRGYSAASDLTAGEPVGISGDNEVDASSAGGGDFIGEFDNLEQVLRAEHEFEGFYFAVFTPCIARLVTYCRCGRDVFIVLAFVCALVENCTHFDRFICGHSAFPNRFERVFVNPVLAGITLGPDAVSDRFAFRRFRVKIRFGFGRPIR